MRNWKKKIMECPKPSYIDLIKYIFHHLKRKGVKNVNSCECQISWEKNGLMIVIECHVFHLYISKENARSYTWSAERFEPAFLFVVLNIP